MRSSEKKNWTDEWKTKLGYDAGCSNNFSPESVDFDLCVPLSSIRHQPWKRSGALESEGIVYHVHHWICDKRADLLARKIVQNVLAAMAQICPKSSERSR